MAMVVDAPATRVGAFAAMSAALTGFTADVIPSPDNALLGAHLLHVFGDWTSLPPPLAEFGADVA
jgi:hypothetical protein